MYRVDSSIVPRCHARRSLPDAARSPARQSLLVREVKQTGAIMRALGLIVPLLFGIPRSDEEGSPDPLRPRRAHRASDQGVLEQRFGFPLIEVSDMTEMRRVLLDDEPPRKIHTHAFGRSTAGVAVGVVNELDHDVAVGSPGEMMIRDTAIMRRRGFLSGEAMLAGVILTETMDVNDAGHALFDRNVELVYFKTPGWIYFVDSLPTTRTQKIQK